MKLEIKNVAPYALHNVRVFVHQKYKGDWYGRLTDVNFISGQIRIKCDEKDKLIWKYQPLPNCKLLLHPLGDLWLSENEKDKNKLTEWDLEYIENSLNIWNYYEIQSLVEEVSFEHVQYLLSRHYDIFNLIMENLAIDIKTLYQN
jgi:hypothetical protein